MSRTLILAAETPLAVGTANTTTVNNATVVRILNDSGSAVVVHVSDSTLAGIGSFTMLNNTLEFIEKNGSDFIHVIGGAVKVSKVGFTA